ncbi:MAG TPA: glycosyltransferase [Chloroflexia bacterium]|nr:glycosyltransferase [Chloroflexia bacterium]
MTLQSLPNLFSLYDFASSDTSSQPRLADVVARKMYAGIIIVSDNSRLHLEKCLTSLLHTVGLDSEVIVVDNASTDGSAEFIAEQFPWVTLIRNASKEGLAAAHKRGIAESTGRYVVMLDPACEVTPGWLGLLLTPLEPDEHGVAADALTMPRVVAQAANPNAAEFPPVCFALARKSWDTLGGLSAQFFANPQGACPCVYVPEALVHYNNPDMEEVTPAGEPEIEVATALSIEQHVSSAAERVQPMCVEVQILDTEPPVSIATLAWLPARTADAHVPAAGANHARRRVGTASPLRTFSILLCVLMAVELVTWGLAMGRRQVS